MDSLALRLGVRPLHLGSTMRLWRQAHHSTQAAGSQVWEADALQTAGPLQGRPQPQTSEESMSQQPQISSSSSEGAGQTAEASAALQSLYEIARSSQHDGASSRAPRLNYRRAEKDDKPERSPASDPEGRYAEALLCIIRHHESFLHVLYLPSATAIPNDGNLCLLILPITAGHSQ